MDKQDILVNPSQSIVQQVLNQVVTGDDKDFIVDTLSSQFKRIDSQYILMELKTLYVIV